ncbi:SDR family oxidoreductase [Methanoplanus endosymbiosus]|uniref:SDR family oxidoreductase n=1 Tax=Methanoplanus endosymbiosus TaxID=33865 RepID=A0A9E7PLB8_9EURY|nr:SDR family oxidoreductase [Methanoplanus endosymbiosus]UUX92269.1 SDR family oxidoreductase [Methanoplanus endosymbiosus]
MKYIVTGGMGFIGSNLSEYLAKDHDVTIIDDGATGRYINIKDLVENKTGDSGTAEDLGNSVNFVKGSITDLDLLKKEFEDADGIFHQGAIPSVPRSVADPARTSNVNIEGTLNVLIAARDCGVRKVVFASSSSVYGNTPTLPKVETMCPSPLSPYALQKLAGETYCRIFTDLYGLDTVALRYFNVFGPKQDPNSQYAAVIPNFIKKVLNKEAPIIYGDGEQTRDFTYVKNVIQANVKAMESDATGFYNIACGERISLNNLAKNIMEILNFDTEPIYEEPRVGDVRDSLADISKANKAFNYKPEYSLNDGLRETIEWYQNQ